MQYPVNQVVVMQLKCKVMMQGNFFYICVNLLTNDEKEILECFYDAGRDVVGAAADCRMQRQGAPAYGGGNASDNVFGRADAGAAGDFAGGFAGAQDSVRGRG